MQALVYTMPRVVEWREWKEPQPAPDEVLVRVRGVALCGPTCTASSVIPESGFRPW